MALQVIASEMATKFRHIFKAGFSLRKDRWNLSQGSLENGPTPVAIMSNITHRTNIMQAVAITRIPNYKLVGIET